MNIPKKVKIGFKDYEIQLADKTLNNDEQLLFGMILYNDGIIKIVKDYSKDVQFCTLMHEAVHAIDELFSIGLEEDQAVKLGKGIAQFIKDNPQVFK